MDNRIEPTTKGFDMYDLEGTLRREGKKIDFCRSMSVDPINKIPVYNHPFCTMWIAAYSQKDMEGLFVRDKDGRELHLQGECTNWRPANPFLLGGEEGIPTSYLVKHYGLPKLHGGIGMELIGETFPGPARTHEERAIIVFSFMKNSKTYIKRKDWEWETKDPDDSH